MAQEETPARRNPQVIISRKISYRMAIFDTSADT